MEVDLNPSSSPVDSRHSSPFRMNLSTSASTSLASMGGQMSIDKKRRRSLQQLSGPPSPSIDYDISGSSAGEQQERDGEKEGAGPSVSTVTHQFLFNTMMLIYIFSRNVVTSTMPKTTTPSHYFEH